MELKINASVKGDDMNVEIEGKEVSTGKIGAVLASVIADVCSKESDAGNRMTAAEVLNFTATIAQGALAMYFEKTEGVDFETGLERGRDTVRGEIRSKGGSKVMEAVEEYEQDFDIESELNDFIN